MYYEIYIDTLFIINFLMDLLILWSVAKLLKESTTWLRLFSASAIGAIIVCIIVIFPIKDLFINVLLSYIISCFLMIYLAFFPKNIKQFVKLLIGLYLSTFFIGGSIVSIYYYTKVGYYFNLLIKGKFMGAIDIKTLLLTSSIALIIIKIIINYVHKVISVQKNLFCIELKLNGKKTTTFGLLDTGNNLYDPITNMPVVIVEFEVIKEMLPENVVKIINNFTNQQSEDFYSKISELYQYKIRLIPFNSIGQECGMLIGMVSDYIEVQMPNNKKINVKDSIIAIYNKKLSQDNSYQLLLHPEIIKKV